MAGPYPLATLAPTVTEAGITAPAFEDILTSLQVSYSNIFGSDVSLEPSDQDGGWLAFLASMQNDTNKSIINTYKSYSPTYAQGTTLSSQVKLNGLRRLVPSNSSIPVHVIGQAGTPLINPIIEDDQGNQWLLPSDIVIPLSGDIIVTATCAIKGDITPATFRILSVQNGWQTVSIAGTVTLGAPIESDFALKQRQSVSTSLPAQTPKQAILAAVANSGGIGRYAIYENDTNATFSNGIPAHKIAVVVEGGDVVTIAGIIANKKAPGTGTYGTISEVIIDPSGVPNTINFFEMMAIEVNFVVNIQALQNYTATTGTLIIAAVASALQALSIGEWSYVSKLWGVANLYGDIATTITGMTQQALDVLSNTFNLKSVYQARSDMITAIPAAGGATSVTMGNTINYANGSSIAITLSGGTLWYATVTGVAGAVVTFTPAVPLIASVLIGAFVYVAGDLVIAINEGVVSDNTEGQLFVI